MILYESLSVVKTTVHNSYYSLLEEYGGERWDTTPELTKRCYVCLKAPKKGDHAKGNLILHIAKQHLNYSNQVYECNQCESRFGCHTNLDVHINM